MAVSKDPKKYIESKVEKALPVGSQYETGRLIVHKRAEELPTREAQKEKSK